MRNRTIIIFMVAVIQFAAGTSFSQVRLGTLKLRSKEVYEFQGTDIVVVDTLIMLDSSRVILNPSKANNYFHIKKMRVGKGAVISGRGANGTKGKTGVVGTYAGGPCRDGGDGQQGTPGGTGNDAVNLYLYVTELDIAGNLTIDLTGGDGGEGGKGGMGGGGSAGTRVCAGGSGGLGGPGSGGGNGGNGGTLTITSPYGADLRPRIGDQIIVKSFGGFAGQGGLGGQGGQKGLGRLKDGTTGKNGQPGTAGKAGKPGSIFFERK
jgi:hypothetical protein